MRNGSYTITASGSQTVVITLPANADLQVGDRVTVTGQGGAPWQLAQNAQQYVVTRNLPGNVESGTVWTPRDPDPAMPAQNWLTNAQSASGNRIAAASTNGIYISADGGATWTRSNAPAGSYAKVVMNSDGSRMAAVIAGGLLYTSNDFGLTWTARTSGVMPWSGVYISEDGQKIVGSVQGGSLVMSTDGGTTFAAIAGTAGIDWRAVAGSADGTRLLAVASRFNGTAGTEGVYVSTNGGTTWARRTMSSPEAPLNDWSFAACSNDCMRMAVIDNGGYPWISDDGGATFEQRFGYSNWSGLAVSGDGSTVSALEPRNDAYDYQGHVFISPAAGKDPWWFLGENRWYRGVSLSYDGQWVVAGDTGLNGAGGRIYTSQGNRTSGGTLGSIGGGQGQSIEVTYQGNGRFTVTNYTGGPFTIR